ncbi:MAG: AraC family transcriptional regulator [Anaerolineae bacterium]|nr:AraC family transcriptional regulator [Anaerolineae bacterium]
MTAIGYIPHDERLRMARAYLDSNYTSAITIQYVSREAALSPYHFIRLFGRVYKQTPYQYLIQRRIDRAKELLRSSDLSITEICLEVGFESLGSFSTLFRKTTGLSPSEYRKSSTKPSQPHHIPLCVCLMHGINLET